MNQELTVAVCAYNAGKYLTESLDSLEKQSIDFQIMLIDDCSRDETLRIMTRFSKNTGRKVILKHMNENRGTAYCRNWALHHADTKLMMFFDADDIAFPDLVGALYQKIMSSHRYIAVSCYSLYIDQYGKRIGGGQRLGSTTTEDFLYRAKAGKLIFMLPITMFYRKEALAAGGYRLDGFPKGEIRYQDLSEDLDLWSRMSDFYTDGKIMITIPETHYYYRKHKDSLSSRKDRQLAMNFKMAYIKHNLKLRRMSKPEVTYVQFIAGLSDDKRKEIERDFWAGYHYRAAAYSILEHRYFHALKHMIQTVFISPKFAAQKLKASL